MTTFDDRLKSQEAKYALDQETAFKVTVRRNRLLARWAAEQIGLDEKDTKKYEQEVVDVDFTAPGDDDVLDFVHGNLTFAGVILEKQEVRDKMDALMEEARLQVVNEKPAG